MPGESGIHADQLRTGVPVVRADRHQAALPVEPPRAGGSEARRSEPHVRTHRGRGIGGCRIDGVRRRGPLSPQEGGRRTGRRGRAVGGHPGRLHHRGGVRQDGMVRPPGRVRTIPGRGEDAAGRDPRRRRVRLAHVPQRVVQRHVQGRSDCGEGSAEDRGRYGHAAGEQRGSAAVGVFRGAVLRAAPRLHWVPERASLRRAHTDALPVPERRGGGRRDALPGPRHHCDAQEGQGSVVVERAGRRSQRQGPPHGSRGVASGEGDKIRSKRVDTLEGLPERAQGGVPQLVWLLEYVGEV
mmetsp:Transcript_21822/g.64369  ORF Transcript_21822/g.64369 Transcript_21822/m.64369 type:complete len:297 (-) Transcript_21822:228-1118(-)